MKEEKSAAIDSAVRYRSVRLPLSDTHRTLFESGKILGMPDFNDEDSSDDKILGMPDFNDEDSSDDEYDRGSMMKTVEIFCLNGNLKNIKVIVGVNEDGEVWKHIDRNGQLYNVCAAENGRNILHKVNLDGTVDDSVNFEYGNENMTLPTSSQRPETTRKAGKRF